jgi:hypothetical protein
MIHDRIVDEVRAIREELAARFGFDIRRIVEDPQRRQAASQSRVVSFEVPPATNRKPKLLRAKKRPPADDQPAMGKQPPAGNLKYAAILSQ